MPAVAYLNGVWQRPEDAQVSVLDRGFLFGDGVYEVVPVYQGKPFTLDRHLDRLAGSLSEISLPNPHDSVTWTQLIAEGIARSELGTAYVYVQVTRGTIPVRRFEYPENPNPTVLMMVYEAPNLERKVIKPYKVVTLEDFRWSRGHIKTVSLIAAGMLKNEAITQGADDAILFRDGFVSEATSANVFIVRDGVLVTPPKSNVLLHGITRDFVIELARQGGIEVEERPIPVAELGEADEIMVTSAGNEAWPVGQLNGKVVGNGEGGVIWKQIDELFQAAKQALN